ncbi:hypothetical protein HPB52_015859 [Rhipicephalus sanguineus]|uniref:Uncharacterized protein n=1 Tax=Rhipicephalus sanguineus TaxID=34632 RepID=A0A9D4YQ92_RHISA|nr:hypothetical protein HPB52_015859 [Rhipicephalus sanguineus]
MNPLQTLRLFILYQIVHLSGHRNNPSREAHQENRKEYIQEIPTYASKLRTPMRPQAESNRADRSNVAQASTLKLHVSLSGPQKKN